MSEEIIPQKLRVFLADDHFYILKGYINVLNLFPNRKSIKVKYDYDFVEAKSCEEGYHAIMENANTPFDLCFMDISMPDYLYEGIYSGQDLAKLMRQIMPNCKIVMLTMHEERLKVEEVLEQIEPEGLIIKNDITFDEMMIAMKAILVDDDRYYSKSVIKYLNSLKKHRIYIDTFDKEILYYLRKGILEDDVALYNTLSSPEVRARVANMKFLIDKEGCTNDELIEIALDRGML